MSKRLSRVLRILISVGVATLFLMAVSGGAFAQEDGDEGAGGETTAVVEEVVFATVDDVATVQTNLDFTWMLLAGFLVFFMQAGFAMLEGGFIRQTGVVNSMAENFMDACVTGIMFFIVGYGIAYADGSGVFGTPQFFLGGISGTGEGDGQVFINFFFQFAFAGAAATIATGAMAERTDFRGKLIYSVILGAFIYPIVVFWTWGGGWLSEAGFLDFAGSTIVHQTGGVLGLVGAFVVGPRVGRIFGKPPRASNLMMASLGTFILWFGWYGFNVGSTLAASDLNAMGLVVVNTTLAAAMGAITAMFYAYFIKGGKWEMGYILNGSLAGLVAITAGCAFMAPGSALLTGAVGGIVLILAIDAVEAAKIDDAVGAFAVHGAAGMWGSLAIGLFGLEALTGSSAGLLVGGGVDLLGVQALGVVAVTAFAGITGFMMFKAIALIGLLRMPEAADEMGIDAYEHGASVWPDVLPMPTEKGETVSGGAAAPATGD
ncbi:MAG: ammonium transporter [Chloroflexota bacterium]